MSEGMRFTIRVEDNSKLFLETFEKEAERALYAIGVKAVEGSVDAISGRYDIDPAVDTGRLRASISFITPTQKGNSGLPKPINTFDQSELFGDERFNDELSGKAEKNTVVVGSNVNYAEYVHNGTSKIAGRPFLREGIDRTKDQMQEQVDKIFKGQL